MLAASLAGADPKTAEPFPSPPERFLAPPDLGQLLSEAEARNPAVLAARHNTDFLQQCVRRLPAVNFADAHSGRIYLRMSAGVLDWVDADALRSAAAEQDTRTAIEAIAPGAFERPASGTPARHLTDALGVGRVRTLGRWGA